MLFRQFLTESKKEIYHGDNYQTKKINVSLMNNGNNQEGIGIYFSSDIAVAKGYGSNIVSAEINHSKFIDSRKNIGKYLNQKTIAKILKDMYAVDEEAMYYEITNWIDISEPEDIEDYHLEELAKKYSNEESRNFQVMLADIFGVEEFVKSWNKHTKIDGTYQDMGDNIWYAVINPKVKLIKV